MGDLLQHLILRDSQESFHTANDDEPPSPPASSEATEVARSENPCSTATIHTTALQAAGLPVFDINEYLASPTTQAILDSTPPRKHKPSQPQATNPSSSTGPPSTNPTEPVQLGGPKTSYFISLLNTLCQARGLTPVFEILDRDGGFGAKLSVGGEKVEREGTWATKKEAREKIAESGVEVVRGLASTAAASGTGSDNWVGRLGEFHNADPSPSAAGPIYTDFALGPLYACEVLIAQRPHSPFGSRTLPFPSKKAAKTHAAHEAVQWLIATGCLNPDASPKRRKKPKLASAVKAEPSASAAAAAAAPTFGQRVNDLYPRLGLSAPEYRIAASAPAPNFHSGAAFFPRDGLVVQGPVGEVRSVFGKKNAREECAKGVLEFLEKLARSRGVELGEGLEVGEV